MKRREFITLVGAVAAATWPIAVRAQQHGQIKRIGVLVPLAADDIEMAPRLVVLQQRLQQLGWTVGQNVRIDFRWTEGDAGRTHSGASELVAFAPDVILAQGAAAVGALQKITRTLPIVFVGVADPVAVGLAASFARPGGNATGFTNFEYGMSGKWLELLKEIAPRLTRAAILRDPSNPAGLGQFGALQSVAPSLGVELSPVDVRDASEIERTVAAFAQTANGGLIVLSNPAAGFHRDLIVALAARHQLPAIYPFTYYVNGGGLISYGPNQVDQYRQVADYIDRILRGEKPAELPVQAPTKFELVINLKTAKALGLDLPATVLARADEVIE